MTPPPSPSHMRKLKFDVDAKAASWRAVADDRDLEILTVLLNGCLNRNSTDLKADRRVWSAPLDPTDYPPWRKE